MVFKSEPIQKCINHAKDTFSGSSKVIHLSASGATFSAQKARELSDHSRILRRLGRRSCEERREGSIAHAVGSKEDVELQKWR